MAEDWDAAAVDIAAAIEEVGFTVNLLRQPSTTSAPWNLVQSNPVTIPLLAMDRRPGRYRLGNSEVFTGRSLMIGAKAGVVPVIGDKVNVRGTEHDISSVDAIAPGGIDLFYLVGLGT